MFTGIITAVGTIRKITPKAGGFTIEIDSGNLDLEDVTLGDSIALNGCCLTVVAQQDKMLSFDVSPETLAHTRGFVEGGRVNLEKAMRLTDRLGGHLVSGHVDGVGKIVKLEKVETSSVEDSEYNYLLEVEVPDHLARYIAAKGSITINGVSLTSNTMEGNRVRINLIPHTFANTVFSSSKPGDEVNVEVDLIARYIAQLLPQK